MGTVRTSRDFSTRSLSAANNNDKKNKNTLKFAIFLCWFLSVSSALAVVNSTYKTRQATQHLEELRREAVNLKVVSGQYLLEQSSLGAYSRVEKIARQELGMKIPGPKQTVLVKRQ